MADNTTVHIGENSPQQVAYKLMQDIAKVERKILYNSVNPSSDTTADRKWILDTYSECLSAVQGNRYVPTAGSSL